MEILKPEMEIHKREMEIRKREMEICKHRSTPPLKKVILDFNTHKLKIIHKQGLPLA